MKKWLWVIPVLLVAAYVFALPYITVYQIRQAVAERDSVALSEHVDFPGVRQSLKDQFNAMLMGKIQSDEMKDNPFAALGMALVGPLVDKMLDVYITPAGIEQLLSGEKPSIKNVKKIKQASENIPNPTPETTGKSTEKKPLADVALGYKSASRFEVKDNKNGVRVILRRKGLTWTVTEIILPEETESSAQ